VAGFELHITEYLLVFHSQIYYLFEDSFTLKSADQPLLVFLMLWPICCHHFNLQADCESILALYRIQIMIVKPAKWYTCFCDTAYHTLSSSSLFGAFYRDT